MKKYLLRREPRPLQADYERDLNAGQLSAVMHPEGRSGTTMAGEALYLCYPAASQGWQGGGFPRPPRFITELPGDSFEETAIEGV